MTKVVMCDPPEGWVYGFPKPVPDNIDDIIPWLLSEGYPQAEIDACGVHFHVLYWLDDVDE